MGSGGEVTNPLSFYFFTEGLIDSFSLYHNVGMTYEEYWHGPFEIIKRYNVLLNKSEDAKVRTAWLHGYMTYVAVGSALGGTPYPEVSEYLVTEKDRLEDERAKEREAMKSVALIHNLMGAYNKQ